MVYFTYMKNPIKTISRIRKMYGTISNFSRFRAIEEVHRKRFPKLLREITREHIGPAGEIIKTKPKEDHSEGDFMLAVFDKSRKPLGEMELKLRASGTICIESMQGEKGKAKEQEKLFKERKLSWSNVLVEHALAVAKRTGIRYVFLIKPERQFYLPTSPNQKNATERLLKIKKRFGFIELPSPKELFPNKVDSVGELPGEFSYFYTAGKGKYWVLKIN